MGAFRGDGEIDPLRRDILDCVRSRAGLAPGLFTLTVPTGGGARGLGAKDGIRGLRPEDLPRHGRSGARSAAAPFDQGRPGSAEFRREPRLLQSRRLHLLRPRAGERPPAAGGQRLHGLLGGFDQRRRGQGSGGALCRLPGRRDRPRTGFRGRGAGRRRPSLARRREARGHPRSHRRSPFWKGVPATQSFQSGAPPAKHSPCRAAASFNPSRVRSSIRRYKYSVQASAVGRPVEVRAYADRIEPRQEGRVVGEHARAFGRGGTVYTPSLKNASMSRWSSRMLTTSSMSAR